MADTVTAPAGRAAERGRPSRHSIEFLDAWHRVVETRVVQAATMAEALRSLAVSPPPAGAVKLWIEPARERTI